MPREFVSCKEIIYSNDRRKGEETIRLFKIHKNIFRNIKFTDNGINYLLKGFIPCESCVSDED